MRAPLQRAPSRSPSRGPAPGPRHEEAIAIERSTIEQDLAAFVAETMLDGSDATTLDRETPLLEWGILNSVNTVRLLSHIKRDYGVSIPHRYMTGQHFKNIRTITDMVVDVARPAPAAVGMEDT